MTLYLTNWKSRALRGPGRAFTIMAKPRRWERGEGRVSALAPLGDVCFGYLARVIESRRSGVLDPALVAEYRAALTGRASGFDLSPGALVADLWPLRHGDARAVVDGNSLLCACSREDADGNCHRMWVAPLLVAAGWNVILDGQEHACRGRTDPLDPLPPDVLASALTDRVHRDVGRCRQVVVSRPRPELQHVEGVGAGEA